MSCFPYAALGKLNSQCPGLFSWLLPCEESHYPFCLCGVLRLTLCRMARRVLYSEQEQVQLWFRCTREETNTQLALSCLQVSRVPAALHCGRQDERQTHPEPELQTMITTTALSQEEERILLGEKADGCFQVTSLSLISEIQLHLQKLPHCQKLSSFQFLCSKTETQQGHVAKCLAQGHNHWEMEQGFEPATHQLQDGLLLL